MITEPIKMNENALVNFNKCLKYAVEFKNCSVSAAIDENGLPFMLLRVKTHLNEDVPIKIDLVSLEILTNNIEQFKIIMKNFYN